MERVDTGFAVELEGRSGSGGDGGGGCWISESHNEDVTLPLPLSPSLATPLSIGRRGKRLMETNSEIPNKKPCVPSDDDSIPEWAQLLEPVRKLPTNVGSRIRRCINEALEKNPPKLAETILEHSISEGVYKANASGLTKNLVLAVLAYARIENNQTNEAGPSKGANTFEVNDDVTPEWVQVLEPVRELNTNHGDGIRRWVDEALEKNPPRLAKTILEHSITEGVYKANASGLTKNLVIAVLAYARVENNQTNEAGPSKEKKHGAKSFEVNDDVIPEWVQVLEPGSPLNTNHGDGIQGWVNETLDKNPPGWAKDVLEYSISEGVYIDNDLGQTKKAIISALLIARPRSEMERMLPESGLSIPEDEGISLRKLFSNGKKDEASSVEAHLEMNSTVQRAELEFMKSRVDELQQELSKLQCDKDRIIEQAKKDAVEEFKNSDEFRQEVVNAVTRGLMNGSKS